MGLYVDAVLPRLINWTCSTAGLDQWRETACKGLRGTIVEIGFGSGTNVPFYPADVTKVVAVEPSLVARRLAAPRIARSDVEIEQVGLDGHSLPLDDDSCDGALVAFTLCSVHDAALVLHELRRVLRGNGSLHFLEHGIAPDDATARWQRRMEPLQKRVAGGCHLTRDSLSMIADAGFTIEWSEQRFARGPRPWSFFSVGVANKRAPQTLGD